MIKAIKNAAELLAEVDAAGWGLVILRADRNADIRRVIENYPHKRTPDAILSDNDGIYNTTGSPNIKETIDGGMIKDFKKKIKYSRASNIDRSEDLFAWLEDCISEDTGLIYRLTFIPNSDDVIGKKNRDSARIIALIQEICEEKRKGKNHALIVIGSKTGVICDELAEYAYTIDVGCPEENEIVNIISGACEEFGGKHHGLSSANMNEMAAISRGMREDDIRAVINLAYAQHEKPAANDADELFKAIIDAKKQCITGVRGLRWINNDKMSEVGGMDKAKEWLKKHGYSFQYSFAAEKCKVPPPKGVLLAGLPGCGKTLFAKMASAILSDDKSKQNLTPILQLDLNTVQGGVVGESEANLANALRTIENVAPCIVIIDEIEKFFEKSGDNGGSHEVTRHLLSTMLDWMQTKRSKPVLVIATANEVDKLPPELKRKGRFDETFFVGVPTYKECENIFKIHFNKRKDVLDEAFFDANSKEYEKVVNSFFKKATEKKRFFNGADIESILDAAFCSLFAEKMGYKSSTENCDARADILNGKYPKYSIGQVQAALLAELEDTRSYFDNNMSKTAAYWVLMKELNFRDSGGKDLFEGEGLKFDPEQGKFNFKLNNEDSCYGDKTAKYIRDGFYDKDKSYKKGYLDFLEDRLTPHPGKKLNYDEAFRYKLAISIYKYVQGQKLKA